MSFQGWTFALFLGVAIGTAIYSYFNSDTPQAHGYQNDSEDHNYFVPNSKQNEQDRAGSSKRRRNAGKEDKCIICLDLLMNGRPYSSLSCDHLFHNHCIRMWQHQNKTCPICRAEAI